MKKLLLLLALCLPAFATPVNYDTVNCHALRVTRTKGTQPGTAKFDALGQIWSAAIDTADSAGVAHLADTCKHEKDTVRAAYKADTVLHPVLTTIKQGYGITVTQSVDTFTVALYTPPVIAALTNTSPTNYAGQMVTGVTVNWTLTGAAITGQTLTDCTPALSDRTHAFTGLSLTSDKYYTLAITDGVTPTSASTWLYFYVQKWYGTTTDAAPTAGDVQGGTGGWTYQYAAYRALGATNITGGGNYIFYAYPSSFGTVALTVNGFGSTWNRTTVSLTNSYGDTRNYYVYTSPTQIVGTISLIAVGN
jgi:hypothetical protein